MRATGAPGPDPRTPPSVARPFNHLPSMPSTQRILFSGAFQAGQCDRAREELSRRLAGGARDVLYIVPNGAAKRAVIQDLVQRRGAAFGVRVVAFGGLPREIERRAHAVSPPALDALTADMLAEQATRHACRSIFAPAVPIGGLARRIAGAVDLLERDGATSALLAAEIEQLGGRSEGTDVLLRAWERMERLRPEFGRTAAEAMAAAVSLLRADGSLLDGCELVVLETVPLEHILERELVEALIAAAPGDVIAACDSADHLAATPAARRLARLRSLARWDERPCTRSDAPFDRALRRVFSGAEPEPRSDAWRRDDGVCVRLLEAAGDVGEVRLAARVVQRHLREGVDPADVLVLFRSPGRYLGLIDEVFGNAGIPVAVPRPRTAAETGLGDVLVRLLRAALHPDRCTREESLALLRTPHLDLGDAAGDRLEWEVVTGGLLGYPTWRGLDPDRIGERTLKRVERFRRALGDAHDALCALEQAADAALVARRLARGLRLIGNAYFARMRALRRAGGDPALRLLSEQGIREDNQAWEEIEAVLDRMPELLRLAGEPDAAAGLPLAERWLAIFVRALRAARVPVPFPGMGAVRVGGTGAVPVTARVVVVLGLLEHVFPRQARQDPFLRDEMRRALRERRGWHLPLTEDLAEAEREHFVRAVSSATEVLYLAHAATDGEGRPALRSFFVEDLQRVLPYRCETERTRVSDLVPEPVDAATRSELLASVAHDVWQHLPSAPGFDRRRSLVFAVHDLLLHRQHDTSMLGGLRRPEARPAFDPALFEQAPHRTLRLSASQLRTIGHCTYQHFVDKVLRPEALQHPAYDALRKGSLLHDAIMEWATEFRGWERGEEALDRMDAWFLERTRAWPPSIGRDEAARHQARGNRVRLREFLAAELDLARGAAAGTAAVPRFSELAFGEQAEGAGPRDPASVEAAFPLVVDTADGSLTAHFRGSIDRVDVFERDGRRFGVAIDYKTGSSSRFYAREMLHGYDLQLRLYLLALQKFWDITPVGALYIGFGDGVRHGAVHADFADHVPGIGKKEVVRMPAEEWEQFVFQETPVLIAPLVDRIARLDITASPRDGDCGFCSLKPLCRFDARTAGEVAHG